MLEKAYSSEYFDTLIQKKGRTHVSAYEGFMASYSGGELYRRKDLLIHPALQQLPSMI